MDSVTLIRRPREDLRSKTGLGRYSDGIEELLDSCNQMCKVVEAPLDLKSGYYNAIVNGFIKPWFGLVRDFRNKDKVVHATDELCGFFLPFVRGHRIITVHHVIKPGEDRSKIYYHLWYGITRCALKHCEQIVVVSPDTGKDVEETFSPKAPINIVFSPVMPGCEFDRSVEKEKVIGIVAELLPRKNVTDSLVAFKLFSEMKGMEDYTLEICGHGMCREELDRKIQQLGIADKVTFKERLSDTEIVEFYNRIAVLLNTSLHEGIGMVTVEANICGTPTFHLDGADIPDRVLEASIACKDPADMAEKVYSLLQDDEEYAERCRLCVETATDFGHDFGEQMKTIYGL